MCARMKFTVGMPHREAREIRAVGNLLVRPLAPPVLPDVVEHAAARASRRARRSDRAAGRPRDGSRAASPRSRPRRRIARSPAAHARCDSGSPSPSCARALPSRPHEREHRVVAERDVGGRRKVRRRREAVAAEYRRHVARHADRRSRRGTAPRSPRAQSLRPQCACRKCAWAVDQRLAHALLLLLAASRRTRCSPPPRCPRARPRRARAPRSCTRRA